MISTTKKKPEDKENPDLVLQAVNNSPMKTYGFREIPVKIGRKTYQIKAVVVDLDHEILGMDFINRYRLGLDWIDGEYKIVDRKAQIQHSLSFVAVPRSQIRTQSLAYPSTPVEPESRGGVDTASPTSPASATPRHSSGCPRS